MLPDGRSKTITESEFAWERNALEFLRKHLPDHAPYRAWTNFEFVADNGKVYGLNLKLSESGAHDVYISAPGARGIIEFLTGEPDPTTGPDPTSDHRNLIAIEKALDTAGIRRSNRPRRVGQYELR